MKEVVIHLENGNDFSIKADHLSSKNLYVKEVLLNGIPYHKAYLTHQDIMKGGELRFIMSNKPNKQEYEVSGKPYSLSN